MTKVCIDIDSKQYQQILSGETTAWYLPLTDENAEMLLEIGEDGEAIYDDDDLPKPLQYDQIEFVCESQEKALIADITETFVDIETDEAGKPLLSNEEIEDDGETSYEVALMVYYEFENVNKAELH